MANLGLFFKIDVTEWVVFKHRRSPDDMEWEEIKLGFPWGIKTKEPEFRFNLMCFGGRRVFAEDPASSRLMEVRI